MKEFQADFTDHNFQEIYDTIKEYYPIEEQYKNHKPEALRDFPGYQKIWQLVEENFVNRKNYKERWTSLSKHLKTSLKKRIVSSNGLFDCCASGEVIMDEFKSILETWRGIRYIKALVGHDSSKNHGDLYSCSPKGFEGLKTQMTIFYLSLHNAFLFCFSR